MYYFGAMLKDTDKNEERDREPETGERELAWDFVHAYAWIAMYFEKIVVKIVEWSGVCIKCTHS